MVENKRIVIVGAGHNGLVAAGYLAGAGLEVQVLERRDVVGGAAVTEEWFPGYRISTCSHPSEEGHRRPGAAQTRLSRLPDGPRAHLPLSQRQRHQALAR